MCKLCQILLEVHNFPTGWSISLGSDRIIPRSNCWPADRRQVLHGFLILCQGSFVTSTIDDSTASPTDISAGLLGHHTEYWDHPTWVNVQCSAPKKLIALLTNSPKIVNVQHYVAVQWEWKCSIVSGLKNSKFNSPTSKARSYDWLSGVRSEEPNQAESRTPQTIKNLKTRFEFTSFISCSTGGV